MPPRVTARQTHIAVKAAREIRFTMRKAPRSPTSSALALSTLELFHFALSPPLLTQCLLLTIVSPPMRDLGGTQAHDRTDTPQRQPSRYQLRPHQIRRGRTRHGA